MGELAKSIGYIVIVIVAIGLFTKWKDGGTSWGSKADCRILAIQTQPETFITNNDFDFGYVVRTRIRNAGSEGAITVKAFLSTSEGNFERSQLIVFTANQEDTLSYQFPEPTVNATGVQSRITCSPSKANQK